MASDFLKRYGIQPREETTGAVQEADQTQQEGSTGFLERYGIQPREDKAQKGQYQDTMGQWQVGAFNAAMDRAERYQATQGAVKEAQGLSWMPGVGTEDAGKQQYAKAIDWSIAYQKAEDDARAAALEGGQQAKEQAAAMQTDIDAAKGTLSKQPDEAWLEMIGKAVDGAWAGMTGTSAPITSFSDFYQGQIDDQTKQVEELEGQQRDLMFQYYSSLFAAKDFEKNSAFKSTANGKAQMAIPQTDRAGNFTGRYEYTETGYDDILYDYINGEPGAVATLEADEMADVRGIYGASKDYLKQMSDNEIAVFNYLYASQGPDAAYAFLDLMKSDLYYRKNLAMVDFSKAFAEKLPILASLGSVAMAPMKVFGVPGMLADYADDGKIDPNAPYNQWSTGSAVIRDTVGGMISDASGPLGGLAEFGYQTVMSMGDFMLSTAVTGGNQALSLSLMGAGATVDTVRQGKLMGYSDDQAFWLGAIAGGAEIAMEKIGMDALFDAAFRKSKGTLMYILKNALSEGGEEVGTELINTIADTIIAGDKSQMQRAIDAYMAAGKSESEAFGLWIRDKAVEIGVSFAGGAVSGGVMGGGMAAIDATQVNALAAKIDKGLVYVDLGDVVAQGLELDPASNGYALAQMIEAQMEAGETISNKDVARLMLINETVQGGGQPTEEPVVDDDGDAAPSPASPAPEGGTLSKGELTPQSAAPTAPLRGEPLRTRDARPYEGAELGDLMADTVERLRQEADTPVGNDMVQSAIEELQDAGKLSRKTVVELTQDRDALAWLSEQTGIEMPDTASGKRNAVRAAVQALADGKAAVMDTQTKTAAVPETMEDWFDEFFRDDETSRKSGAGSKEDATHGTDPLPSSGEVSSPQEAVAKGPDVFNEWFDFNEGLDEAFEDLMKEYEASRKSGADSKEDAAVELDLPGGEGQAQAQDDSGPASVSDGTGAKTETDPSTVAQASPPQEEASREAADRPGDGGGFADNTVGSAESRFVHEVKDSKVYENTFKNATSDKVRRVGEEVQRLDPDIGKYDAVTEKESLYNAELRTQSAEDMDFEYQDLMDKERWSGEDNDVAMRVLQYLRQIRDKDRLVELGKKQREQGTEGGQLIQSFAKYTRKDPTQVAVDALLELEELRPDQVDSRFFKKSGKKPDFEGWKVSVSETILDVAEQLEQATEEDMDALRDTIRSLAQFRRTTAWMGFKSRLTKIAERGLMELDYETARAVANAQLSMLVNDFRKRSIGQVVKTIRIHNMLASIATFGRNLAGNAVGGVVDGFSDSTVGRGLDILVSLATGKRTVGNDFTHGKTYFSAATKAAKMAALCAELDIPMDSESRFATGHTRTWSPNRGIIGRFFSAYEKGMKYALEVTDQFFEGGAAGAVRKSLGALGEKSGLTAEEIDAVAGKVGKRRTYKDDRAMTRAAKGVKKGLNELGPEHLGLGDLTMPFAGTGSNLGHTAMDYSGAGVVTGLYEIVKLIRDVRRGDYDSGSKTIRGRTVTLAEAQRQAVTNAARGITGVGLVAAFAAMAAAGILKVHDDEDKDQRAMDQAQGLSGAQFNVDAMIRGFTGGDTTWREGDHTVSVDFLEPFNAQMYIGWILSQEESLGDTVAAFPGASLQGVISSVLDMPMMQGLSDTFDLISDVAGSLEEGGTWQEAAGEAAGHLLGSTATSFIPAWMRNTAYMVDPYYRDTTGDGSMDKAWNQIKSNIPFLSQTLPLKYSGTGEAQMRHEGGISGFFSTYIDPGKSGTIHPTQISQELDRIYEATGNTAIWPEDKAPGSFTYDGETVVISGKEMTEVYQKTYGENVTALYGQLMGSADFQTLSPEGQAAVLESAKAYATGLARAAVSDYASVPSYIADRGEGVSEAAAILYNYVSGTFDDGFAALVDAWSAGEDGGAGVEALRGAWEAFQGLSEDARSQVKGSCGGRVAAFLGAMEAGMDVETFAGLYRKYREISEMSETANARQQEWVYTLDKAGVTGAQKTAITDRLHFSAYIPQEAQGYQNMVDAGLDIDTADYVFGILDDILPEEGRSGVRNIQKLEAIVSDDRLTDEEVELLMPLYLDDGPEERWQTALEEGYTTDQFVEAYRIWLDKDSGTGKTQVIRQISQELGISYRAAKELYEIYK